MFIFTQTLQRNCLQKKVYFSRYLNIASAEIFKKGNGNLSI
jgi:hypothetical protein